MESVERAEPRVAVIMGSDSDWSIMQGAGQALEEFGVPWEARVVSAHRTPRTWSSTRARRPAVGLRDRRGGGRGCPPSGDGCVADAAAGDRRAGRDHQARPHGRAAVDRADARGRARCAVAVDGARNAGLLACGSSGGRSLRTGRASSDYGTIGGLLWPVGRRHRSGIAGQRYALAGVVLRLSTVANACECITCRRVIGRPRLGGHPRPGSTSMSDDVTISPHFPQRSSICVTLPHAR